MPDPDLNSLLGMLSAPIPPGDEAALWARADALLAKILRFAYHTRKRRKKAKRRYLRAHHAAGRVMMATLGAEIRGEREAARRSPRP